MKNEKGFTLIELLVVIAIIGLLSTLAVVALGNATLKARDAKRQSDIKVMQTAIEVYSTDNGSLPPFPANWDALITSLASQLHGGTPQDPGTNRWCYCANGSKYLLAAVLEETKDIPGDIDTADVSGTYTLATDCLCDNDLAPSSLDCGDSSTGSLDGAADSMTVICLGSV